MPSSAMHTTTAGGITVTSVVNTPTDPTGSKFTVTFSKSDPSAPRLVGAPVALCLRGCV